MEERNLTAQEIKERNRNEMLIWGCKAVIIGICAIFLVLLWILAFHSFDKSHLGRSMVISITIAAMMVAIFKKGILDVLLGKVPTEKYILGYQ